MMSSLFSAISGLTNHQTRMDVIGNNIANVNTIGFKYSRTSFSDTLSQTLKGAAAAQGNKGGTNPMQIGLGVGIASIDTVFTDGSYQPTGKQTDLAIQGQGFFILSDGLNQVYTRAGAFDFDTNGNFLVPGTGYKVMGWQASNGTIDTTGTLQPLKVPAGTSMPAKQSTSITFANNLSSKASTGSTVQASIVVYDAQGNDYKLSGTFTKTATLNEWTFTPSPDTTTSSGTVNGSVSVAPSDPVITFDANGKYVSATSATITITPTSGTAFTINTLDFSAITQFNDESTVQAARQDGYPAGTLDATTIDTSGVIVGRFTNGQSQPLGQIALAVFNNPGGLIKKGESLYLKSTNSGEPQIGATGTGGRGTINPSSLEMSNVNLAQEFSNMIITQRGYQANSKIISVADEMLQELANLKR